MITNLILGRTTRVLAAIAILGTLTAAAIVPASTASAQQPGVTPTVGHVPEAWECDIDPIATHPPFPPIGRALARIGRDPGVLSHPLIQAYGHVRWAGTHIGGGFFTGHNHPRTAEESPTDFDTLGLLHWSLPTETPMFVAGEFVYRTSPDSQRTVDLRQYYVPDPQDATAVPIVVFADEKDFIGQQIQNLGWPRQGARPFDNRQETSLFYSTGDVINAIDNETQGRVIKHDGNNAGGLSGTGAFIRLDADGNGTVETMLVGSVFAGAGPGLPFIDATTQEVFEIPGFGALNHTFIQGYSPYVYEQLTDDMAFVGVRSNEVPCYTLMSGFDAESSVHTVTGSYLRERLIGGTADDTLDGGGGDDLLIGDRGDPTGASGNDTFVITTNGGHDVIRDFNPAHDSLRISGPTLTDVENDAKGATAYFDDGRVMVSFEGLSANEVREAVEASGEKTHTVGFNRQDRWHDEPGNDIVEIGAYGARVYAGQFRGDNQFSGVLKRSSLTYERSAEGVQIDLPSRTATSSLGTDTWTGDFASIGASPGDDVIVGDDRGNWFQALGGNDVFRGGGGGDNIIIRDGAKHLDGGEGHDSVHVRHAPARIDVFNPSQGRLTDDPNTYISIESIHAGAGDTTITIGADSGVRRVFGGSGNDTFAFDLGDFTQTKTTIRLQDRKPSETIIINGQRIDTSGTGEKLPAGFKLTVRTNGSKILSFGDDDALYLSS